MFLLKLSHAPPFEDLTQGIPREGRAGRPEILEDPVHRFDEIVIQGHLYRPHENHPSNVGNDSYDNQHWMPCQEMNSGIFRRRYRSGAEPACSIDRGSLSPLGLRDEPRPRDPQKARTLTMLQHSRKASNRTPMATFAPLAKAKKRPSYAQKLRPSCTPLFPLSSLRPHLCAHPLPLLHPLQRRPVLDLRGCMTQARQGSNSERPAPTAQFNSGWQSDPSGPLRTLIR
jgi:hypothetical protein